MGMVDRVREEGGSVLLQRTKWREQQKYAEMGARVKGGTLYHQHHNEELAKRFRLERDIQEREWDYEDAWKGEGDGDSYLPTEQARMEQQAAIRERENEIAIVMEGLKVLRECIRLHEEGHAWVAENGWQRYIMKRDVRQDEDEDIKEFFKESKKDYKEERQIRRDEFIDGQQGGARGGARRGGGVDAGRQQGGGGAGIDGSGPRGVHRPPPPPPPLLAIKHGAGSGGSGPQAVWVRAEEVYGNAVTNQLRNKYVSVEPKDSVRKGKFVKKGLDTATRLGRGGDGGFLGNCAECGERGHQACQCPKNTVVVDGKQCVTSVALYLDGLCDAQGKATR